MGFRATIAKALEATYNAIGDIPVSFTYRRVTSSYSTATGTNTTTNTDYIVKKGLFLSYETMEIDKNLILATDQKLLIQSSSLPVASVNIATDKIVGSDGKVYNIVRVTQDPAGATLKFQLRTPS